MRSHSALDCWPVPLPPIVSVGGWVTSVSRLGLAEARRLGRARGAPDSDWLKLVAELVVSELVVSELVRLRARGLRARGVVVVPPPQMWLTLRFPPVTSVCALVIGGVAVAGDHRVPVQVAARRVGVSQAREGVRAEDRIERAAAGVGLVQDEVDADLAFADLEREGVAGRAASLLAELDASWPSRRSAASATPAMLIVRTLPRRWPYALFLFMCRLFPSAIPDMDRTV